MPDFSVRAVISAVDKFTYSMGTMGKAVSGFGAAAKTAFERAIPGGRALSKLFGSMAGQVAIGNLLSRGISTIAHSIASLPDTLKDFAARGQEIGRTASIIGVSAEAWQRWSYAAKLTDTSTESLQSAMQKLNRNMADLSVGKGTLMDIVKYGPPGLGRMIGRTHDATEAMLLMADAFHKVKDPQVRARTAVAAFGKAGQDLIPLLSQGREGLMKLMKKADIYGSVLTDNVIEASSRADDTLKRLTGVFGSLKDKVLSTLLVAITPYVEKALAWVTAHEDLIKQKIPQYIDAIKDAAIKLWDFATKVVDTWKRLNDLADGHLARDIFILVGAWKAVRLAIDLAKAAQIAFSLVSAATGAGGAGAAGAGAAQWAVGTGWAGGVKFLSNAAKFLPVAAGAGVVGNALAPAMRDPSSFIHAANAGESMQGGNWLTNIFSKAYGFGAGLHGGKESQGVAPNASTPGSTASQKVDVNVLLKWLGDSKGVGASVAPPITGAQGAQYGMGGG